MSIGDQNWSGDEVGRKSVAGTALIGKACDILEIVGAAPGRVDQAELSRQTGIPRATLYRILAALTARGIIRSDPVTQRYSLGFRLLEHAQNVWGSSNLVSIASSELRLLRDMTGETAYLAVLHHGEVLALGRFEGAHSKRSSAQLGALKPVHCTSQGKAILAHLRDDQVDGLLREPLERYTEHTTTDPAALKAQLQIVRARGYAIDDEEILYGTRCVGVAILDENGHPVAAISVAGPSFRMHHERAEQLGHELVAAARRISSQLGASIRPAATSREGARVASQRFAFVGASPFWDQARQQLVWIDRLAPAIHRVGETSSDMSLEHLGGEIDCAFPCGAGLAVTMRGRIIILAEEGVIAETHMPDGFRASAARVDRERKVWLAVYRQDGGSDVGMLGEGGSFEPIWELSGEVTSMVFDTQGETLFAAQPQQGVIHALELASRRKRVLNHFPKAAGQPVGLAIDREDRLWVAASDGWSVVRLNEDGDFEQILSIPVSSPTGIAFGGPDMSTLYVTTARAGMSREQLQNAPQSGHLLAIDTLRQGLPGPIADLPFAAVVVSPRR
ncbi:IclR family transcriptional regulator domain-containing protein [Chelativorans alearense]|uniref:IclR family transcriptional regulator domain-containing protein n=1 Tax=Chelativorans alearense TaxID=2681495 RepID=UPI0013D06A08|nr:IclR family transcriptional regulator C-terminal domain-containing protein [Chelativorans alearense]